MEAQDEKVWVKWNTVFVGSYKAFQFKEVSLLEAVKHLEEDQITLEEEAEKHPDDCLWWQDWHACNCGAFDVKENQLP